MKRWEDMSREEQDELYPVRWAALWCLAVFGLPALVLLVLLGVVLL